MKKTGDIIKGYRLKRGYSLRQLGKEIGVGHSYIDKIEKEVTDFPKNETRDKIIEALLISIEDVEFIDQYEDYKKTPERFKWLVEDYLNK